MSGRHPYGVFHTIISVWRFPESADSEPLSLSPLRSVLPGSIAIRGGLTRGSLQARTEYPRLTLPHPADRPRIYIPFEKPGARLSTQTGQLQRASLLAMIQVINVCTLNYHLDSR